MPFKILWIVFILILLSAVPGMCGNGRWEDPWSNEVSGRSPQREASHGPMGKAAETFLRFFIKYISPVDGDRCPSYPTCSQYGLEAVRKHGALIGTVMTIDRLIHEADEVYRAPLVRVYDTYRYYDPVENNDFWWDKDSKR